MSKNEGKRFEENFRKSIPSNCWYYRLRDSAASYFGGNEMLRFSSTNIADCLVHNGEDLFICELKAHTGKSLPLSCIKKHQIEGLLDASKYSHIKCYLFVFFYQVNKCYALKIQDFYDFYKETERKSIPISYFEEKATEIEVKPLKTNHRFILDIFK